MYNCTLAVYIRKYKPFEIKLVIKKNVYKIIFAKKIALFA